MPTTDRYVVKEAFLKSIPIMCSYVFVSMAYGIMMENAGFAWYDALAVSLTVYTGAFQFVLVTLLSSGASIITIALTAFLMNSRQSFYALTFVNEFHAMGKRKLYMIHTMTDETYAVNCSLKEHGEKKRAIMFWVALFSRCYWMVGAVAGAVLGQMLPAAIMAVLIIYCLKDGILAARTTGIAQLLAVLAVAITYKWKHNTMLSIVLGTAVYMLLIHVVG